MSISAVRIYTWRIRILLVSIPLVFAYVVAAGGLSFLQCARLTGTDFGECLPDGVEVKVDRLTGDEEAEGCNGFQLSEEVVIEFFKFARILDGQVQYREYDWYPCALEGTLNLEDRLYRWKISPGGKGFIYSEGQLLVYLGCGKECETIFPGA